MDSVSKAKVFEDYVVEKGREEKGEGGKGEKKEGKEKERGKRKEKEKEKKEEEKGEERENKKEKVSEETEEIGEIEKVEELKKIKFEFDELELTDPVKMLVEMAKKGEINPWNIDVVEVADKFLSELERAKKLDLRISGRVLLYAAILVRMKAEILAEEAVFDVNAENAEVVPEVVPDEVEFEDFEELGFTEFDSDLGSDLSLKDEPVYVKETEEDEVISYLLSPYRKVRRFTTLKDLIKELKKAEKVKRSKRKKVDRSKEILKVPHEEEIEDTVLRIGKKIEELLENQEKLSFMNIVKDLDLPEVLSYYISILYLSFRGKINIEQEKLFEDDIIIFKI